MNPENIPKFINSVGLAFDIAGAWLVATEVVNKFKGKKYDKDPTIYAADEPPFDSEEYKDWELSKYKNMRRGLICLTIGFSFQFLSIWPCLFKIFMPG